jgi:predicted RNA-binding Zn-ribbon protein involved in translation (DUF1610 family)
MIGSLLLLGTLATLPVVGYFLVRSRFSKETVFRHFRCPACGQKLRCAAEKVGRPGMCPRCGERWSTPPLPKSPSVLRKSKLRQPVGQRTDLRRVG